MAEQNLGFVNTISKKLNSFVFGTDTAVTRSTEYVKKRSAILDVMLKMSRSWTSDMYETTLSRKDKYKRYENLDLNLAEASASLNVYADNVVSGAIGGEENYKVVIDPTTSMASKLDEIVKTAERQTGIKDTVWDIARDLTSYGDVFEEVVVQGNDKGDYSIGKLKELPREQIYAYVDERGVWLDPKYPYIQKKQATQREPDVKFDWWRLIHFKIGRSLYGVDRSIFANASNRIGRQLLYIDDALVLARISRAWMRYAFFIDVTGLTELQKWEMVDAFMSRVRRTDIVDRSTGRVNYVDAPLMPDEDVGIPIEKDSMANVKTLTGDMNIGNIDDVEYLQTKFLMAMNIPKAYVALEEGLRTKATLTQLDVQFARQVRRRQRALLPGLRKFYRLVFILAGIDPDSFKWEITFPELATTDEMLKFEMLKVKAEIAKILVTDVGALNTKWVLEVLMEMNESDIEKYQQIVSPMGQEPEGGYMQLSPETVRLIRNDPFVRQIFDDLRDTVALKMAQDEARENLQEIGIERTKKLSER